MKLKRELGVIDSEVIVEGPRTKRRKRGSSAASPSPNEDVDMADGDSSSVAGADTRSGNEAVKELGQKILNSVRNAQGKDGRLLSHDFLRLPSKRQYPDYYNLIKHPISLDEIKAHLDRNAYPSIDAVKQDFDRCFRNAKRYNMRDSQIWKDAKALHKIVLADYKTLIGIEEDVDVVGSEDVGGSDEDEERGKALKGRPGRPLSLNRLLKVRMQKLVDKTDDTGRLMTEDFMELPSKKIYPIYYKTIKKLMCFDAIFKKIKRKEYSSAAEFAADVELVFSNALTFNEEHSAIWEDAAALKKYFKYLMSDLPASHALPEYSGAAHHAQNGKLKLKVPALAHTKGASAITGGVPLTVKLPAPANAAAAAAQQQTSSRHIQPAAKQGSASKSPNLAARQASNTQSTAQASSSYLHPATFSNVHAHHPQPQYHSQATSQTQSATHSISPSPLPPTPTPPIVIFDHPLRSLTLKTMPLGRTLRLDSTEGVRTWVLRLGKDETALDISGVRFLEVEESDEDEGEDESKSSVANGKGDVIVKINGKILNAKIPIEKERGGNWQVSELRNGSNVLEVGERDGEIWKVVLQRIGLLG